MICGSITDRNLVVDLTFHGPFQGAASSLLEFIKEIPGITTILFLCASNIGFNSVFSLIDYLKEKQVLTSSLLIIVNFSLSFGIGQIIWRFMCSTTLKM
jgi:hypothetical protein